MTCAIKRDICVIRGDGFEQAIGFDDDFDELVADPSNYRVNMVFREAQDDTLTPYLTITVTPEAVVSPAPLAEAYPVAAYIVISGTETQALPDWDHFYYVELAEVGGDSPTRLFQGKAKIGD